VHGRSAAGGWSQHRFARRREGQVRQSLQHAASNALEVLVPRLGEVDAVVLGGDRHALDELREDRRLAPLFARAEERVLDVAEPRLEVLVEAAERAVSLEIVVRDS
jgi:peptide subunit release factor 1 (eRF1)